VSRNNFHLLNQEVVKCCDFASIMERCGAVINCGVYKARRLKSTMNSLRIRALRWECVFWTRTKNITRYISGSLLPLSAENHVHPL